MGYNHDVHRRYLSNRPSIVEIKIVYDSIVSKAPDLILLVIIPLLISHDNRKFEWTKLHTYIQYRSSVKTKYGSVTPAMLIDHKAD